MIISGDAHSILHNNGLDNNYSDYEGGRTGWSINFSAW